MGRLRRFVGSREESGGTSLSYVELRQFRCGPDVAVAKHDAILLIVGDTRSYDLWKVKSTASERVYNKGRHYGTF